jgi:hypothetical protein
MIEMGAKNIILLANQPNQAIVMAKVANRIWQFDNSVKITITLTDYYTFYFQKQFLTGFKSAFNGSVLTQEEIYKEWQNDEKYQDVDLVFLNEWSKSLCNQRSLDQLARTNQWVYGNENDRYLLKTNDVWKTKILFDTIVWCEELVLSESPSVIVSLGNETLPTNVLYEIACKQVIPFLTIIHTRLENYWILREDFAYGMAKSKVKEVSDKYTSFSALNLAEHFIEKKVRNEESLYSSASKFISNSFAEKRKAFINSLKSEFRDLTAQTYWRAFSHTRERPYKVRRVEQNLIKVTLEQIRYFLIFHARMAGFRFSGTISTPKDKFFLWGLHVRPESSVLVLGDGIDEIDSLIETADQIPIGYFLAVKENPVMMGRRDYGFYKKLKNHKKIILVDPFVSSIKLIKESVGVIGISGTILLEATFFDKPSCALGNPEFADFLIEKGWGNASAFFDKVISNNYESPKNKIMPYIAYLLSEAKPVNLFSSLDTAESEDAISGFALEILHHLNSKEFRKA